MLESSKIKRIREKLGLSQEKLARLADVSNNTIINIEAGKQQNPTIDTIKNCESIKCINRGFNKIKLCLDKLQLQLNIFVNTDKTWFFKPSRCQTFLGQKTLPRQLI